MELNLSWTWNRASTMSSCVTFVVLCRKWVLAHWVSLDVDLDSDGAHNVLWMILPQFDWPYSLIWSLHTNPARLNRSLFLPFKMWLTVSRDLEWIDLFAVSVYKGSISHALFYSYLSRSTRQLVWIPCSFSSCHNIMRFPTLMYVSHSALLSNTASVFFCFFLQSSSLSLAH